MYNIVDNAVIVIAKVSGEYRVLDSGSILVFEDRQVLGSSRSISGENGGNGFNLFAMVVLY